MVAFSALVAAFSVHLSSPLSEHVPMEFFASGMSRKYSRFLPIPQTMTPDKPAGLKKAPMLVKPTYGVITFQGRILIMILDEQPSGLMLYLDSNGNGDLTDDAPADWKPSQYAGSDGKQYTIFRGNVNVDLTVDGKVQHVSLNVYKFDKNDAGRKQYIDDVFYYGDFISEGTITLDGKAYRCYLVDWETTGYTPELPEKKGEDVDSGMRFAIDVNGNGIIDGRGETFGALSPFNISGTTYKITKLGPTGIDFERSTTQVKKVPLPPGVGDKAPDFEAKPISGSPFQFRGHYKKQLVMLFFWASVDNYSSKEIPGLVSAYDKFNSKGFEVLGVNCDTEKVSEGLKQYIVDHKIPWPQISEHYRVDDDVISLFVVRRLPSAYLIDGDTGVILATIEDLRGDKLVPTIEKELAAKKRRN